LDKILWLRITGLCLGLSLSVLVQAAQVVTFQTRHTHITQQVLGGFRDKLQALSPGYEIVSSEATPNDASPALLFALGSEAARAAHERFPAVPLLACMIVSGESIADYPNASGILLKHNLDQQLDLYRRMLPDAKKIGILYSPKNNQERIELIEKSAAQRGLRIVGFPVNRPQELPASLKAAKRQANSIMAILDPVVYSSKTAKGVLLFSFRNKMPFIGLSETWVKAGALYAMDWDYQAMGEECALQAIKRLSGQQVDKLKVSDSSTSRLVINLKTAKSIHVAIDKALVEEASRVFE
jgi:putative ABC transport system substrate-binding protein